VVLPLLFAAASAQAQDAPREPTPPQAEREDDARAVAETLFFTARGLMEAGRIEKACNKFAESYRLDPAAGTLLNLAVCHEKQGRIASAWGEFRQAVAEARKANRPDREELARAEIDKIEPDLPFLTLSVPREMRVAGLKIERNGIPLNDAAWDTELPIDPGTNEIVASAPGYERERKTIAIEKRQHLTVALEPLIAARVEAPPPPYWTGQRRLGAVVTTVGVAGAAVGAVFGVLALQKKSQSDAACPTWDGQLRCSTSGSNAMSTAQTDAWVADIGIGAGAAAIVLGGILFFTGGAATPPEKRAGWGWTVTGGAQGAQAVVAHSF
jgi:tetratricopeptide (TPR) repeat protein